MYVQALRFSLSLLITCIFMIENQSVGKYIAIAITTIMRTKKKNPTTIFLYQHLVQNIRRVQSARVGRLGINPREGSLELLFFFCNYFFAERKVSGRVWTIRFSRVWLSWVEPAKARRTRDRLSRWLDAREKKKTKTKNKRDETHRVCWASRSSCQLRSFTETETLRFSGAAPASAAPVA